VIDVIAWLAALVALLTSLAMLQDTHVSRDERAGFRLVLGQLLRNPESLLWNAGLRAGAARLVRFHLRACVLVAIAASSGVSLLLPQPLDLYSTVLRLSLVVFLAMQAPCPWLRWIWRGDRRDAGQASDQGASDHVHR